MDPTFPINYVSSMFVAREIRQKLWHIFFWTPCISEMTNNIRIEIKSDHDNYDHFLNEEHQLQHRERLKKLEEQSITIQDLKEIDLKNLAE